MRPEATGATRAALDFRGIAGWRDEWAYGVSDSETETSEYDAFVAAP